MKLNNIKGVFLDWAGTTVDYGCFAPIQCFMKVFKDEGIDVFVEEARQPMGLKKRDHIIEMLKIDRINNLWNKHFGRQWNEDDINRMYKRFEEDILSILHNYAEPIKGAIELTNILRENNISIGSTSGYTKSMMDIVASNAKDKGYYPDYIVAADEVKAGRPYPYMIYKNAENLSIYPLNKCVKIGDTISDIKEGVNGGLITIGIIKGGSELGLREEEVKSLSKEDLTIRMDIVRDKFLKAGASYVADSLEDVKGILYNIDKILGIRTTEERKLLFTPGPLTTSEGVKKVMDYDYCTWDDEYKNLTEKIRASIVNIATKNTKEYTTVLLQGSGTYSVEGTLSTVVPKGKTLLICSNGAYGERMIEICKAENIDYIAYKEEYKNPLSIEKISEIIDKNKDIYALAMIHCETTTGILNPVKEVGEITKKHNILFIVDAMSSFGGIPMDISDFNIDFLISSSNKCIEGVPGFGFIVCKRSEIERCKNNKRTLSLDIYEQWRLMENTKGKWRFTSPTHVVTAFYKALKELEDEGGVEERYKRYSKNQKLLAESLKEIGINSIIDKTVQSPIITTFIYPNNINLSFNEFYKKLKERGFIIYPGKLTKENTFRVGNIGKIYEWDIRNLSLCIKEILG